MIVAAPEILSPDWMIIGRQIRTDEGGFIDLLALAPDGTVVLIELKRDKTPREVVAQTLDYAVWVESLDAEDLHRIYSRYSDGGNLDQAFADRFKNPLDEDSLNQSHQLVIVAASLDKSSERIVDYLSRRDIAINVLCFQVFDAQDGLLLSRAWLHDPIDTQVAAVTGGRSWENEPWNGEFYASFGDDESRSWNEAKNHGFLCGGGGAWYSATLKLLNPGDRVWVKVPKKGFVAVGRVRQSAVPARDFQLRDAQGVLRPALDILLEGHYHRDQQDDDEKCEYFVAMDWAEAVPLEQAFDETGLFGNQNTVCKPKAPKWRHTVERLKHVFPHYDDLSQGEEQ